MSMPSLLDHESIRRSRATSKAHASVTPAPLRSATLAVYLREPLGPRSGPPSAAQGRDLHAALFLNSHLVDAGFVIRDSLILEPVPKPLPDESRPLGRLNDFDFAGTDLIVQTTRPCLDDAQGTHRKARYHSFHAIEQSIHQSLRRLFQRLDREQVILNPKVPIPADKRWLGKLAFGLYHTRPDGLAEATRWTEDHKQVRLPGTTFGYLATLRRLDQIDRPFLALFGMSREDTFRLACSLHRFPGLVPKYLQASEDCLAIIQITRSHSQSSLQSVRLNQDFETELVVDTTVPGAPGH